MNTTPLIFWIAPAGSLAALIFAFIFFKQMMTANPGDARMVEIAGYVTEGAMAYLRRQYKVVAAFFAVAFLVFMFMAFVMHVQSVYVPFAFLTGGFFSGLAGFLGMKTATAASSRTAQGAKESLDRGLKVAFRAGAVMGLVVVGLGLLDICLWYIVLTKFLNVSIIETTVVMLCFGMGASFQALFARVGGGIYTKAADVGADLVGKVEAGIPEDDPRNPATIADNVGDNVGDVAGMGADLYESYCGSILATAALGAAAFTGDMQIRSVIAPMVIAGIGVFFSIIGCYLVRTKEGATQKQLLASLGRGVNASAVAIVAASYFVVKFLLPGHIGIFWSIVTGLLAGIIIGKATEYYTSADYKPTQKVAEQSQTGPATIIISGIALGMKSTLWPVLTIGTAMILAYAFAGGFASPAHGLYGIGIAAVGMLSTLGITLATDAYGPIADNAGGNAEMSGQEPQVRERTDALDSLGNTTAATGKGFAIGSAALTALALLAAYIEEVRIGLERIGFHIMEVAGGSRVVAIGHESLGINANEAVGVLSETGKQFLVPAASGIDPAGLNVASLADFMDVYGISLDNPVVLVGMFIGAMMAFFFCALTMEAVGRAAGGIVEEVRRQFREIAGLLEGREGVKADYARCVDICTASAQKEMILPAMMALIVPVLTGIIFGVAGVMGLLAGGLATGFVLAIMMANAGGSWDNAKKYIEQGDLGGKGSDAHKAAVVGDTVGDPFKDTSGPSLNILIKLMSMVSVVFAGLIVSVTPLIERLPELLATVGL